MSYRHEIFVTGGTGFVGTHLIRELSSRSDFKVVALVRDRKGDMPTNLDQVYARSEEISAAKLPFRRGQVVVHLAARAHLSKRATVNALHEYRKVNVAWTLEIARQAAAAGVNRFIFISSIGVNGNANSRPFNTKDIPAPAEFYAQSKWEAEQELAELAAQTSMELVVIRPPLVYGPNAPGNFGELVRWIGKGIPLPLGAIHNKRSLVGIDNLVDLIIRCIDHPAAANQVFLAGDGEDLSTTELLRGVARAMGKPARLIPVPAGLLQLGATLLGKKAMAQRLLGSLQVDISKTCEVLDWKPPYTVEEGLRRCFEPSH